MANGGTSPHLTGRQDGELFSPQSIRLSSHANSSNPRKGTEVGPLPTPPLPASATTSAYGPPLRLPDLSMHPPLKPRSDLQPRRLHPKVTSAATFPPSIGLPMFAIRASAQGALVFTPRFQGPTASSQGKLIKFGRTFARAPFPNGDTRSA